MYVGLVLSNNKWFCPYVNYYLKIFDALNINYNIISWNRDGTEQGLLQYDEMCDGRASLFKYLCYLKHVIKTVRKEKFDKLVILCPVMTILLTPFLWYYYNKRYIVDYRDLSIDQNIYLKYIFLFSLKHSAANIISSPGFIPYLPKGLKYILSHNFDYSKVIDVLKSNNTLSSNNSEIIDVLTIGGIRDYDSNIQVIDALGNKKGFNLRFVGKGIASGMLEEYVKKKGYKNVQFIGFYKKDEEASYIESATFINIYYPRKDSHDSALSNRFYNSLIYRKPMITTAGTTQGNYASYHKVGVAIENCNKLDSILLSYKHSIDYINFSENANKLLAVFVDDYKKFSKTIVNFCEN